MKHVASPKLVLALGLALGIAVDVLFHGHALGISVPLFVLLLLAALFYLGSRQSAAPAWRNLWLLAPLVFFSAMVAVRASPFLTFLNVVASVALLGLVAHYYAAGHLERLGLLGYPVVWLRTGLNAFYHTGVLLRESLGGEGPRRGARSRLWPVLRGLLLALPVLAVFTILLSSADVIFGHYVGQLLRVRLWREFLGRATVVLVSAWLLAGGLAYALKRAEARAGQDGGEAAEEPGLDRVLSSLAGTFPLAPLDAGIVLGAVDLLFVTFVGIQSFYLFGGQVSVAQHGYTYAGYARRGFFELVTVAVLSLGLILGFHWLTRRETPAQGRMFNALSSVLAGLVLVMLASAFYRLRLYQLAYGLTELRLYVYVFMGWLGAAMVWLVVVLWRLPGRFAAGASVAALGFLVTLNLLNPDAFIAQQNVARYRQRHALDASYLATLSDDATPVLLQAMDQLPSRAQDLLSQRLQGSERRMREEARWRGWQSLHLSRWRAYGLLSAAGLDAPR